MPRPHSRKRSSSTPRSAWLTSTSASSLPTTAATTTRFENSSPLKSSFPTMSTCTGVWAASTAPWAAKKRARQSLTRPARSPARQIRNSTRRFQARRQSQPGQPHPLRHLPTNSLVALCVSRDRGLLAEKLRKRPLRTHVLQLHPLQVAFGLDRGCHRHHAIQAPRVVGSVIVLCSTVHTRVHPLTS